LDLVGRHCSGGRLLDVGCALGIYTEAFLSAGFDAYGIDISEFAVGEAAKRVGPGRIVRCDLDQSDIPFGNDFDVFWMWDVVEHSARPLAMLQKVTARAAPGAWLFLHTSNADSLSHMVFREDWEGFSDYSHHGVREVTASALRAWLVDLGWNIREWDCSSVWVLGGDPVRARLAEAFSAIPELTLLLSERDLGDLITVVAQKG
jgi:2-polyprenyl-3-methyl-5-hydroxy-6-metoxy-1,4-benzoquinol methylase